MGETWPFYARISTVSQPAGSFTHCRGHLRWLVLVYACGWLRNSAEGSKKQYGGEEETATTCEALRRGSSSRFAMIVWGTLQPFKGSELLSNTRTARCESGPQQHNDKMIPAVILTALLSLASATALQKNQLYGCPDNSCRSAVEDATLSFERPGVATRDCQRFMTTTILVDPTYVLD